MTIRRFLPAVILTASTAFGQLASPQPDRLADYLNWFAPLNPATNAIAPALQTPGPSQIDTPARLWVPWVRNAPPTSLLGPILGVSEDLYCEVVFLGQTGSGWGSFGFHSAGNDFQLSTDAADRHFGSYALPPPLANEEMDFYIERSDGSRYYAFNKSLNSPGASPSDGYWGTLVPLSSFRGDVLGLAGDASLPFAVFAFAPEPAAVTTAEPDLFVFAVRAGYDAPTAVPEPATYGVTAAAALLALALLRRRRRRTALAPVAWVTKP